MCGILTRLAAEADKPVGCTAIEEGQLICESSADRPLVGGGFPRRLRFLLSEVMQCGRFLETIKTIYIHLSME